MDIIKNSALEVYWEADYNLDFIPIETKHTFFEVQIQYNQLEVNKASCTLHASLWALSDLSWVTIKKDIRDKLWNDAVKLWASDKWRRLYKAVDLVRNFWKKEYNPNVSSYCVDINSDEFWLVINKGYSIVTWYRWNKSYNLDKNDNCVLDDTEFWTSTYGHCIRLTKKWDEIFVVDNLFWIPCNVYKIKDFKQLVKNWIFFNKWYFYYLNNSTMVDKIFPETILTDDPEEEEIIKAWKREMDPTQLAFKNYKDKYSIEKMLIDLNNVRKWLLK